jgi:hypothetical protein
MHRPSLQSQNPGSSAVVEALDLTAPRTHISLLHTFHTAQLLAPPTKQHMARKVFARCPLQNKRSVVDSWKYLLHLFAPSLTCWSIVYTSLLCLLALQPRPKAATLFNNRHPPLACLSVCHDVYRTAAVCEMMQMHARRPFYTQRRRSQNLFEKASNTHTIQCPSTLFWGKKHNNMESLSTPVNFIWGQ